MPPLLSLLSLTAEEFKSYVFAQCYRSLKEAQRPAVRQPADIRDLLHLNAAFSCQDGAHECDVTRCLQCRRAHVVAALSAESHVNVAAILDVAPGAAIRVFRGAAANSGSCTLSVSGPLSVH